jgi:hypothetical protein
VEGTVVDPLKLTRLTSTARHLVDESLDGADGDALRYASRVLTRLVVEVGSSLSETALEELGRLIPELPGDHETSAGELRILEAQLLGWLDGVLQGEAIEATAELTAEPSGLSATRSALAPT